MTEGLEESSTGLVVSPTASVDVHTVVPEEAPEAAVEGEVVDESGDDASVEGDGEGEGDGERGALGLAAMAGACCVCLEVEQVRRCLHSEKICILPIIACLISLALCTAGLKWVFVDRIFEYEPHTHLDPKRIGQDPIIIADPTLGLPVPGSTEPTTLFPTTNSTPGRPEVFVEGSSTEAESTPSIQTNRQSTPFPQTTLESNEIPLPVLPLPPSTTPSAGTSSHVIPCSESEKNYCVNGGDCFTLEVTPGNTKNLCRCPNEFTGDRCQTYVMASFYKHLGIEFMEAEELYQKQVLTITGICIALLVVGIMCVVAYCKTKKQRQKLHDRLRQSLRERNAMATMANGPHLHTPRPPPENIQLVNQYVSKSAAPAKHIIERETETSFSPSKYTSPAHQSTTLTHTPSKSWMNGNHENMVAAGRSALVMSSVEGSRHSTPSHRGRLNATGGGGGGFGARDLGAYLKSTREVADSSRDSPYSERYVSAMTTPTHISMTTPTHLSHVELLSPGTPGSPPSETSAALSSLATSVPSVALSPSVDEDRPLLFLTPPRQRQCSQDKQTGTVSSTDAAADRARGRKQNGAQQHCSKRHSAHYNHGQEVSPPPSPLHIVEDNDEYETMREYEASCTAEPPTTTTVSPLTPTKKLPLATPAKRTKPNGIVKETEVMVTRHGPVAEVAMSGSRLGVKPASPVTAVTPTAGTPTSESSSEESEVEDDRVGEATPFLSLGNPGAGLGMGGAEGQTPPVAPLPSIHPLVDGSRTNPALRLSPQEDLQVRLSSVMTNQDPIAV